MPVKKKQNGQFISPDIGVLLVSLIATFLTWKAATTFPAGDIPVYVFIIGITASFLLFGMVFALGRGERKAAEALEEHARLLSAIESVPMGLVITDLKGQILNSNYELTHILGKPEGETWTLAQIEEKLGNVYSMTRAYNEVLTKRGTISEKDVIFESRHLNIFLTPVNSDKGILGVLILIRDVTNL